MKVLSMTIKRLLPRSLFGRSLIILVTPLILVQIVLGYIFFDRHTETVLRVLSATIAGDIELMVDLTSREKNFKRVQELAARNLKLELTLSKKQKLKETGLRKNTWLYEVMGEALNNTLTQPYYLNMDSDNIYLDVEIPNKGVLHISTLRKRLFSRTTPLVLIWTTASALLLFIVASLFMRNQIRPLRRLSEAADRFGKGNDIGLFKPEGATEVRKAGFAFNIMRDRLRRQLNERTEMLAGVSHDLRTPLTRMKLQLAMMQSDDKIESLQEDVDSMQKMVEGFLTYARGAAHEVSELTNLKKLLSKAIEQLDNPSIVMELECDDSIEIILKIDLFKRCLSNILLNAQKYAHNIWISVDSIEDVLKIIIDDDGPGIPNSEHERVFQPFYRLEASRNSETGGVGLGLTIARDVMRSHGGQIRLRKSPQGGLRVILRLPL